MIIDSHCHAWWTWPYQPPVPDPGSRARVEQLLWEMDRHGVSQAVVICARIDHNPSNNDYVHDCVQRHPARLVQFADVDCSWSETYQAPGAADRLAAAAERYQLKGFTHYVKADDDGAWYLGAEGSAFLRVAAERNLIASFAIPARLQPVLRQLAERFPSVPFLVHHMGHPKAVDGLQGTALRETLASAALPNIHVKLSGFHYVNSVAHDYPYPACKPIVQALFNAFGPERLHWGSDYPVVRRAMTYQQALEAVRTHCDFIGAADMERVLGDSLADLLRGAGAIR